MEGSDVYGNFKHFFNDIVKKNYVDNLGGKEKERSGMNEGKKDWKEGKKWRKKEWSYRKRPFSKGRSKIEGWR